MANTTYSFRLDKELKEDADELFKSLGNKCFNLRNIEKNKNSENTPHSKPLKLKKNKHSNNRKEKRKCCHH